MTLMRPGRRAAQASSGTSWLAVAAAAQPSTSRRRHRLLIGRPCRADRRKSRRPPLQGVLRPIGLDLWGRSDHKRRVGPKPGSNPSGRALRASRWGAALPDAIGVFVTLAALLSIGPIGCAAGTSGGGEPPEPSGRAERALVQVCAGACYAKDQNRAVQADVIRRQCEVACRSQLVWPLVSNRDDVEDQLGRYVRLQGLLTEKAGQPALQLSDGIVIMLRVDPDTAGDLPFQGLVAASGRLEADKSLSTLNIIALP